MGKTLNDETTPEESLHGGLSHAEKKKAEGSHKSHKKTDKKSKSEKSEEDEEDDEEEAFTQLLTSQLTDEDDYDAPAKGEDDHEDIVKSAYDEILSEGTSFVEDDDDEE